jgi:uncharacterized hydrophobic protein (TIGR00271 family)
MGPIISLSMGVLRRQEELMASSLRALGWGIALALGFAMVLTLLTPLKAINSEIAARLSPTLLDLGVAVISGIAGAYAHARAEIARSLAGVAIAVALVPPLAVAGIGIGWMNWAVFSGAFLLFLTNLAGIVFAAAFTFLLLGFSPFHRARRGLILALLLVAIIGVPLTWASARMVDEHNVIRLLDGMSVDGIRLNEIRVHRGDRVRLSLRMISDHGLTEAELDKVKAQIEKTLGQKVELEITWVLVR